jgi:hypothetical protein
MKRIAIEVFLAVSLFGLAGCTSWEKATYQTLAATQATINQAQVDYNDKVIAPTQTAHDVITKAAQAQNVAVASMVSYEEAKAAGGTQANLQALQTDVTVAIASLPTLITDVKALYQGGK